MRTLRTMLALVPLLAAGACVTVDDGGGNDGLDGTTWRATNADVHERLAQQALSDGRLDDAATNAREALRVDGDRRQAALVLARVQLLAQVPQDAERTLSQVLERDPDCVEAWLLRGEALAEQGRDGEAHEAYRRAQERGSPHGALGRVARCTLEGESAEAAAVLDAADVGALSDPAVLKDAGAHRLALGDTLRADALFAAAAALDPADRALARFVERGHALDGGAPPRGQSHEDRLARAAAAMRSGDAAAAAALYGALATELQDDSPVRVALGESLLRAGDRDAAEAAFRAAAKLEPSLGAAWLGIARSQLAAADARGAMLTLERALRAQPNGLAVRGMLVAAALAAGDVSRAKTEAAEVGERAPGSALDRACRDALRAAETKGGS